MSVDHGRLKEPDALVRQSRRRSSLRSLSAERRDIIPTIQALLIPFTWVAGGAKSSTGSDFSMQSWSAIKTTSLTYGLLALAERSGNRRASGVGTDQGVLCAR